MRKLLVTISLLWATCAFAANPSFSDIYGHLAPGGFSRTRSIIATNGPLSVMMWGDSGWAIGLAAPVTSWLENSYGFRGSQGQNGVFLGSGTVVTYTNTPGVTMVKNDFTVWYVNYWTVPNGESLVFFITNAIAGTSTGFTASKIHIAYIEEAGAGTIKVQTNAPSVAFADFQTGINAAVGTVKHGVATTFQMTATNVTMVKITGTAGGTTKIICGSGSRDGRGVLLNAFYDGGLDIGQFNTISTNITGPILNAWAPDLIMTKFLDSSQILTNNLAQWNTFIKNFLPNSEWLNITWQPIFNATPANIADVTVANNLWINDAIQNGRNVFEGNSIFGGTNMGVRNGYLSAANDPHLTPKGDTYEQRLIASWMGLFRADTELLGYMRFSYGGMSSIDATNTFIQSYLPDGSAGIGIAGASIFSDNPIPIRNKVFILFDPNVGTPATFGGFPALDALGLQGQMGIYNGPVNGYNGTVYNVTVGTNQYPASHLVWAQVSDGSCTNLPVSGTAMTNTWLGAGAGVNLKPKLDGTFTLIQSRSIEEDIEGNIWSGATPGNVMLMAMLNTASATNVVAKVLFTPPANQVGTGFHVYWRATCRSTGVSGTVSTTGRIEFQGGTAPIFFTNQVTTLDTTVQYIPELMSTNGAPTDSFLARNAVVNWK